MYHRILNKLDLEILRKFASEKYIPQCVLERINEIIITLDTAYGSYRTYKDMGGYVLFLSDIETYQNVYSHIIDYYRINMEYHEYLETIKGSYDKDKGIEWLEELYMMSSDDALVLIYPRKVQ